MPCGCRRRTSRTGYRSSRRISPCTCSTPLTRSWRCCSAARAATPPTSSRSANGRRGRAASRSSRGARTESCWSAPHCGTMGATTSAASGRRSIRSAGFSYPDAPFAGARRADRSACRRAQHAAGPHRSGTAVGGDIGGEHVEGKAQMSIERGREPEPPPPARGDESRRHDLADCRGSRSSRGSHG